LSFVTNSSGYNILQNKKDFQQQIISKTKKIKVKMRPYGGFVSKI
jgi:hypothetical protein